MAPNEFEKLLSEQDLQAIEQIKNSTDVLLENATPKDVEQGYKDTTGRDLDQNVYGYEPEDTRNNPITDEVKAQAQEAVPGGQNTLDRALDKPTQPTTEQTQTKYKSAAMVTGDFEPTNSNAESKLQQHIKESQEITKKTESVDNTQTMSNDAMARMLERQSNKEAVKEGHNLIKEGEVKKDESNKTR